MVYLKTFSIATLGLLPIGLSHALRSPVQVRAEEAGDRWDAVVLGGGGGGVYTAIRLKQQGLKVALIEKQNLLGGHVDTYKDPNSNVTYDYGVQIMTNNSYIGDYFAHFDIPLLTVNPFASRGLRYSVDVPAAKNLNTSTLLSANTTALATGLVGYRAELAKYQSIVSDWKANDTIPDELLMPFGDWLVMKGLEGAAFIAYSLDSGCGNILAHTTFDAMRFFTEPQLTAVSGGGFLANGYSNNQLLYDRALTELGEAAFLSANVRNITRDDAGVEVQMYTRTGPKRIKARKLVVAIPPKLENLAPIMELDTNESALFGEFNNTYYWDMLISNTGFPANLSGIDNIDPEAALQIPAMPGLNTLNAVPNITGLYSGYYGSPAPLTEKQVKKNIRDSLVKIRAALGLPEPAGDVVFVGFNSHAPMYLTVNATAIKGGFWAKAVALQGEKNTWYTGAAWSTHSSAEIWKWTEEKVLPGLVKSLGLDSIVPLSGGNATLIGTSNSTEKVEQTADGKATYVLPEEFKDADKATAIVKGAPSYKAKRWWSVFA